MRRYDLVINDTPITVTVKAVSPNQATLEVDGVAYTVRLSREETLPATPNPTAASRAAPAGLRTVSHVVAPPSMSRAGSPGSVRAPIPGAVLEVFVGPGDHVTAGQALLKMEAMKMENVISSPIAGTIKAVSVAKGTIVEQGQEMLVVE